VEQRRISYLNAQPNECIALNYAIRTALKAVDNNLANTEQRSVARSYSSSCWRAQESLQRQRVSRLTSAVTLYVSLGGCWEGPSPADLEMMQPSKKK
jgi:hypothetical protein